MRARDTVSSVACALLSAFLLVGTGRAARFVQEPVADLIRLLAAGYEESRRATQALAEIGESALPVLHERLDTPSDGLRWQLVNVLGIIGSQRSLKPLVQVSLKYGEPHARWRAYWAIARVDDGRAADLFAAALAAEDREVAWRAVIGLAFLGDLRSVPGLESGLHSPESWKRWEAVFSLRQLSLKEYWSHLANLARNDPNQAVRQESVMALWRIREPESVAALKECAEDESREVRWRALCAIVAIAPERRKWSLQRASQDADPLVEQRVQECADG